MMRKVWGTSSSTATCLVLHNVKRGLNQYEPASSCLRNMPSNFPIGKEDKNQPFHRLEFSCVAAALALPTLGPLWRSQNSTLLIKNTCSSFCYSFYLS